MSVNSREKGKRGEREFAKLCRQYGHDARRSQQYAGGVDSADVVGLPGVHIEVKYGYDMTIEEIRKFLQQAIRDSSGTGNIPIVAHRKTYGKWFVTMEWDGFVKMYCLAFDVPYATDKEFDGVKYVTMPADDWFDLYREYQAAGWIEMKGG